VRVIYRIVLGEPITLREILVRGNVHTQDRVLRREMTIRPGQLANPKEIERSRARIEATGFFTPDTFHPDVLPPQVRYLDTGEPGVKDIEYAVEEGGVLGFEISGGISTTNGAFGSVRLRKGNFDITNLPTSLGGTIDEVAHLEAFHGAGERLLIEAAPGTQVTRYSISFFEPDIFGCRRSTTGSGSTRATRRSFESHDEERRDYSVRVQRQLTPDSSACVRYGIGSVDVSDLNTGGEPGLEPAVRAAGPEGPGGQERPRAHRPGLRVQHGRQPHHAAQRPRRELQAASTTRRWAATSTSRARRCRSTSTTSSTRTPTSSRTTCTSAAW
jgi:outer membrane protein insertion porin family